MITFIGERGITQIVGYDEQEVGTRGFIGMGCGSQNWPDRKHGRHKRHYGREG